MTDDDSTRAAVGLDGRKPWYLSLAIWSALLTLLTAVLRIFRIDLDEPTRRDGAELLLSAATLAGGAGALWGRWRATRRIGAARSADNAVARVLMFAIVAISLLGMTSGCGALRSATGPYIAADRSTYDAIAPEYAAYVAADPTLSPEEQARRQRTVETWRLRLEQAESAAAVTSAPTSAPTTRP